MASGRSTRPPARKGGAKKPNTPSRASSKNARGKNPVGGARRKQPTMSQRQVPWALIGAIAVIVVLVAVLGYFLFDRNSSVSPFRVSSDNQDPSLQIPGIVTAQYAAQNHVTSPDRVAYDRTPPFGGPHDNYWAACTGTVYPVAVRNENMVHSLEHGAVWIAYNPDLVQGPAVQALENRVRGTDYMMMSPYPGLDQPISLQSWGHQLKLADANDPRIDQFIQSLRQNQYTHPEVGASCDALGPGYFDVDNPPPFEGLPYPPEAKPMNYQGTGVPG